MRSSRPFFFILAFLAVAYGTWLLAFWPGVVGEDGLGLLLQIEEGKVQSQKEVFWYLFVKWLYEPHRRIEVPIAVQLLLCAIIFSRMLAWCWRERMFKTFWFVLLFVALAPQVVYFQSALNADGLFSAAVAGLTFEAWQAVKARKISAPSLAYWALLVPIALFFRANGLLMLAIVVPAVLSVPRRDKFWISAIFLGWLLLHAYGNHAHRDIKRHGALFPLAIFETVNFLQPHPQGVRLASDSVTPETLSFLERRMPISQLQKYFDRDFWDPLVYRPGGPEFLSLTKEEKSFIVEEFLCCNLWKNIPAFLSSRVNIFMVAALAQGGLAPPDSAATYIPRTGSTSQSQPHDVGPVRVLWVSVAVWSASHRWLLWTPFPGIALVLALLVRFWRRREYLRLMVIAPLALQLAGIFAFSIAGEYRYLLMFFTGLAALLPIWVATSQHSAHPAPTAP